jgi:hypothetical protein
MAAFNFFPERKKKNKELLTVVFEKTKESVFRKLSRAVVGKVPY